LVHPDISITVDHTVTSITCFSSNNSHVNGTLRSFPPRRSSDLQGGRRRALRDDADPVRPRSARGVPGADRRLARARARALRGRTDRKSTRLNSSHGSISYAVLYWEQKTQKQNIKEGEITSAAN